MPRAAQARSWWEDVEDVRERIERKREREGHDVAQAVERRRGVREVSPGRRLMVVRADVRPSEGLPVARTQRRRQRPRPRVTQRVGPHPDRVAAWAVVLGFALVLAAIFSAH